MDKLELRNQIRANEIKVAEILDKVATEKRELTNVEKINLDGLKNDIAEYRAELKEVETIKTKSNIIVGENRNFNFSLLRTIRNSIENRSQDDVAKFILKAGEDSFKKAGLTFKGQIALPMESRAVGDYIAAGTAGMGKEVVTEQKLALLPYLSANLVLAQAGATILSGLVGDVSIPVLSTGSTAAWKSEVAAADVAGQGFTEVTLAPKRITAYYDVSKQFLQQDSVEAEAMLQNDLMSSVIDLLEATILGTAAGTSTQPVGLFYSPTLEFSGTSTFANMIALESAVAANNALKNKACYLLHPTTVGTLKGTAKATNAAIFVAENSLINGYPYYTTTNLPTIGTGKAGIFGVFSDLVIGQWGGLDLTIDPYSQAIYGKIRIVINFYVDAKVRRSESFAKASIL